MYSNIFHKNWEESDADDVRIIGEWEDSEKGQYEITVPAELRKNIVEMQNWLAEKYQKFAEAEGVIAEVKNFFAL